VTLQQEGRKIMPTFAALQSQAVPEGFQLIGREQGISAGEFWGSEEQIAIRYRQPRTLWGLGSEITICWAPQRNIMLTGTTNRVGTPATVNGLTGTYHDGMWMPGSGPDEIRFEPNGIAHWGRDLVHSITLKTSDGVYGLRAPRTVVPHPDGLVSIMSSVHALGPA
jgi:hypothetical protein